jgi:hypothetical protein
MTTEQTDKRSASQKIDDLERGIAATFQTLDNMARDIMVIKEAIKLLGNKVDSIVKASERGLVVNDDLISKIMVENNVEELKEKVSSLVAQGVLVTQDVVGDDSFIVGRELSEAGEVVNPRLQFALGAIQEEMRGKIKGSKAGDVLTLEEGKLRFEVTEVYGVKPPTAPEAPSTPPADAPPAP